MKTKILPLTIALIFTGFLSANLTYANPANEKTGTCKQHVSGWFQTEDEAELNMEEWMKDRNYFVSSRETAEETMELEPWMKDRNYFVSSREAAEETMKLEPWMKDSNYFVSSREIAEETMELEPWMKDRNYFASSRLLAEETIEPWMKDKNYFVSSRAMAGCHPSGLPVRRVFISLAKINH